MTAHTPDTSDTTAPHPAPEPATAGLTGASAAVYTALLRTPGTAAEIAVAAGVGRSTAGKALAALEQRGLATRTPGDQHNGRCVPDRWHPTKTNTEDEAATATAAHTHDPNPAADTAPAPAQGSAEEPLAPLSSTVSGVD